MKFEKSHALHTASGTTRATGIDDGASNASLRAPCLSLCAVFTVASGRWS